MSRRKARLLSRDENDSEAADSEPATESSGAKRPNGEIKANDSEAADSEPATEPKAKWRMANK